MLCRERVRWGGLVCNGNTWVDGCRPLTTSLPRRSTKQEQSDNISWRNRDLTAQRIREGLSWKQHGVTSPSSCARETQGPSSLGYRPFPVITHILFKRGGGRGGSRECLEVLRIHFPGIRHLAQRMSEHLTCRAAHKVRFSS